MLRGGCMNKDSYQNRDRIPLLKKFFSKLNPYHLKALRKY